MTQEYLKQAQVRFSKIQGSYLYIVTYYRRRQGQTFTFPGLTLRRKFMAHFQNAKLPQS